MTHVWYAHLSLSQGHFPKFLICFSSGFKIKKWVVSTKYQPSKQSQSVMIGTPQRILMYSWTRTWAQGGKYALRALFSNPDTLFTLHLPCFTKFVLDKILQTSRSGCLVQSSNFVFPFLASSFWRTEDSSKFLGRSVRWWLAMPRSSHFGQPCWRLIIFPLRDSICPIVIPCN